MLKDCLDLVEDLDRNPLSDLEADVYRMSGHGASGMDSVKHFPTLEEAEKHLLNEYGITGKEDTSKGIKMPNS